MNKTVAIVLAIIISVGGGFLYLNMSSDDSTATTTDTTTQKTADSSTETQASTAPSSSTKNEIDISDMAFSPASTTVTRGTTVTWMNNDSVAHTVTADNGTGGLNSGTVKPGETYTFTFNEAGTFTYHCEFHSDMKGTVTVTS